MTGLAKKYILIDGINNIVFGEVYTDAVKLIGQLSVRQSRPHNINSNDTTAKFYASNVRGDVCKPRAVCFLG